MNFNSQEYLAKLLAKENLTIQHGNYQTASFDVIDRVLRLPLWKDKGKDVYDLLVGHEVGHALYTPASGWHDSPEEFDDIPRSYLNIVEDIRIEKMIQRTYPGIIRAFKSGYKTLFNDGLFGKIDDVNTYKFMDRLNIHTKGRGIYQVEFSETEQLFVDLAMGVETWEDVLKACREIKDFIDKQDDYEENDDTNELSNNNEDERGNEGSSSGGGGQSEESTSDYDESEDDEDFSETEPESDTITDDAFRENSDQLLEMDDNGKQTRYSSGISKAELKNMVMSYKELSIQRKDHPARYNNDKIIESYSEIRKGINKTASLMAKEFERKKAAFQYSRSQESKKGSLNVNKLHQYQYSEDIFQTVTKLANAKSHGIIMFMDLSGSMSSILKDVTLQTITIGLFCKKVNIPFEIYTFTAKGQDRYDDIDKGNANNYLAESKWVRVVEVLSNKMKTREFNKACMELFAVSVDKVWEYGVGYYDRANLDQMGSTPLIQTAIAAKDIVTKFQSKNNIEKTNIIFLTDGYANSVQPNMDNKMNIENVSIKYSDPLILKFAGKNIVSSDSQDCYSKVIKRLGIVTNSKVTGFFLTESSRDLYGATTGLNISYQDALKELKKNSIIGFKNVKGYDDYFLIKVSSNVKNEEFNIKANKNGNDISIKDIKRQFKNFNRTQKKSRQIVNKIATAVAA